VLGGNGVIGRYLSYRSAILPVTTFGPSISLPGIFGFFVVSWPRSSGSLRVFGFVWKLLPTIFPERAGGGPCVCSLAFRWRSTDPTAGPHYRRRNLRRNWSHRELATQFFAKFVRVRWSPVVFPTTTASKSANDTFRQLKHTTSAHTELLIAAAKTPVPSCLDLFFFRGNYLPRPSE